MEILRRETDYALRLLAILAGSRSALSTRRLADLGEVSLDLTRKIMQKLSREGFVTAERGAKGGFSLRQEPSKISLSAVAACIQGPLVVNACTSANGPRGCRYAPRCPLVAQIGAVQRKIARLTDRTTLAKLISRKLSRGAPTRERRKHESPSHS